MTLSLPVPVAAGRVRSPDAWLWAAAAAGWLTLALLTVAGTQYSAGGHHPATAVGAVGSKGLHAAAWPAMVATMVPLVTANVRYAAMRSPARARPGVVTTVVTGWALVWSGATAGLAIGVLALDGLIGGTLAVVAATVVAVGWQRTRLKRRSVARCSRRLAPPLDRRRRRRATWRYGLALGRDCVVSCWPLMALATAARHSLPVAGMCVGVAWYERQRRPHHDPATRVTSVLIVASGATALTAAMLP